MTQGCAMYPRPFSVYTDARSDERGKNGDGEEEGREWRLPGLFNADDLVFVASRGKI